MMDKRIDQSLLYGIQSKEQLLEIAGLRYEHYLVYRENPKQVILEDDRQHLLCMEMVCLESGSIRAAKRRYKKMRNGTRIYESPPAGMVSLQKWIHQMLLEIALPNYVLSFKSPKENNTRHRGSRIVKKLDILRFFPNTDARYIHRFFQDDLGCSEEISRLLTNITTYKRHLPTGAPSSPILSFWAYKSMWDEVDRLCREDGCIFTLLIDDITISGHRVSGDLVWRISKVLHRYGLALKKSKGKRYRPGGFREINGVISHQNKERFHMPSRKHLKKLNLHKALRKADDLKEQEKLTRRLKGLEGYQRHIEEPYCPDPELSGSIIISERYTLF